MSKFVYLEFEWFQYFHIFLDPILDYNLAMSIQRSDRISPFDCYQMDQPTNTIQPLIMMI